MKIGPGTHFALFIFFYPFLPLRTFQTPQSSSLHEKSSAIPSTGTTHCSTGKQKYVYVIRIRSASSKFRPKEAPPLPLSPFGGKSIPWRDPTRASSASCALLIVQFLRFSFGLRLGTGRVLGKISLTSFAFEDVFDDVKRLRPLPYGSPNFYLKVILEAIHSTFFGNFDFLEFFLRFSGKFFGKYFTLTARSHRFFGKFYCAEAAAL